MNRPGKSSLFHLPGEQSRRGHGDQLGGKICFFMSDLGDKVD